MPYDYIVELSKLQDEVEPMPWILAEQILRRELGGPPDDFFLQIETVPKASASLAQVHHALLKDGTPVVVKIQREGIRRTIEADTRILRDIATLLERNVPESRHYDPQGIVEEFSRSTLKELNFINEARNMEIFAGNFANEPSVRVPKVQWRLTTPRILTMERISGIKISMIDDLRRAGYDTSRICRNGARLVLKMIFEYGFFHADPHPGNLFVCPGEVIVPVDYGMMGFLSPMQMDELATMAMAVIRRDAAALVAALDNAGILPDDANLRVLEQDLGEILVRYSRLFLAQLDMRSAMDEFLDLVHRHRVRFPAEFMLLGKALVTYEELARLLDPEFDFFGAMAPYVKTLAQRKYHPRRFLKDFVDLTDELRWFLVQWPRQMRAVATKMRRGELQLQFQMKGLDVFIRELDRSSNRLSLALLVAALIVGSSIIATMQGGYTLFDIPLLGLLGYLVAAILGVFLVISILRSRKL